MENQDLLLKYPDGHRHNRLGTHAEEFGYFLLKTLDYSPTIVDIGCGKGRDVEIFFKEFPLVIGIDNDENIIKEAKQKSKGYFTVMDAEHMRFPEESIDGIFCINVLHYVNQKNVIKKIFTILKECGYAFLHFNLSITDENNIVDYTQNEEDIMQLIKRFEIVQKRIFERVDKEPIPHTHKILEVILRKPMF